MLRARLRARGVLAVGVLAAAVTLAGCDGSTFRGDPTDDSTRILGKRVWVVLTTDGGRQLLERRSIPIETGATALDVLQEMGDVRFAPDGAIAQVNGQGGGALRTFGPEQGTWFYRVDGIESTVRPERFRVRAGQSIWWDYRRYDIYQRLPVAVGTFPEPLFSGWRDSARPLRIAYAAPFKEDAEFFKRSVFQRLDPDVVSIAGDTGTAGVGGEDNGSDDRGTTAVRLKRANLIIGRWEQLRMDPNLLDIALDSRFFGVTTFIDGTEIVRQDPDQEFPESLRRAEGLVWAATTDGEPDGPLVFVITGTTDDGVRAAARALRSGSCQFYIACAVDRDGLVVR